MISIVDDDLGSREAIADLLNSLGYSATTFESAEKFLESGCVEATRCLIADVQMPGLSGLDLQSHLRARGSEVAVIFITGYPDESARARALNAGAIAFLNKPFEEASLIRSLEDVLGDR